MIYILIIFLCCIIPFFAHSYFFNRSVFWSGILDEFGCERNEFLAITSTESKGRFLYKLDGEFISNNFLTAKYLDGFLYVGVDLPFEFFIKPLKIPIEILRISGNKRYWFELRSNVELDIGDGHKRTFCFTEEFTKGLGLI